MIFEDGEVRRTESVDDDTLQSCDDGYVQIINISDPQPTQYVDGYWVGINEV
jgi:hypothetical protein